jgi:hypothetical protein
MRIFTGSLFAVCCMALVACVDASTDADTTEQAATGPTINNITFHNQTTVGVSSSSVSFAGFMQRAPVSSVDSGRSDFLIESNSSPSTSFHITYTTQTGGKVCHFDSASFSNNPPAPGCIFTNNAQSQGGAFATCTATITSFDNTRCSQSVTFTMQ